MPTTVGGGATTVELPHQVAGHRRQSKSLKLAGLRPGAARLVPERLAGQRVLAAFASRTEAFRWQLRCCANRSSRCPAPTIPRCLPRGTVAVDPAGPRRRAIRAIGASRLTLITQDVTMGW